MIEGFIRGMLGSWGNQLLDFILGHPGPITALLGVWLAVYTAGWLQLKRIEQRTIELVVTLGPQFIAQKPHITARGLYRRIYPRWKEVVSTWGWFIPHRLDLWPVPVRAETVEQKIPLSAQWIAEVLAEHGVELEQLNHDR